MESMVGAEKLERTKFPFVQLFRTPSFHKPNYNGWHQHRRRSKPYSRAFNGIVTDASIRLQKLVFESSEAVSVISTFDDLGLKEDLVRGIYAYSSLHAISRLVVFLDLNNYRL